MKHKDLSPKTRRNYAYQDMSDEMRETALMVHAHMRRANLRDLLTRHSLGRTVRQVTHNPGLFGQDAVRQLAAFTGIPGGIATLAELKGFSQEFAKGFIIEQAREPMANGAFISYGHFRELMRLMDRNRQRQFLDRVRTEGLTVAQLRREITAEQRQEDDAY